MPAKEHHPKREAGVAIIRLWGYFAARSTGALPKIDGEEGELRGYIEAASQDISQEVKAWLFHMDKYPKHISKTVAKWLKDNKIKVLEWPSQSPELMSIEKLWAELKKHVRSKEAYKPDSVTPALSGGMDQICSNLL